MTRPRGDHPSARTAALSAAVLSAAVLSAACGSPRHRVVTTPPLPCTPGTHVGLGTRALAWGGQRWGALATEGGMVYLREYTSDGVSLDGRTAVLAEPSTDPRLALGWAAGAWEAVVAPRSAPARIVRLAPGEAPGVRALEDVVTGEPAVVPRAQGAALFYGTASGTRLRLLGLGDASGEGLGTAQGCPVGVEPRSVAASGDRFVALVPVVDRATEDGIGVDVLVLDAGCREDARTHLWDGALNGRVHALAADGAGTVYAAFGDRDGAVWLAVVTDGGAVRVRPRRLLPGAGTPRVLAGGNGAPGADVVAVRTDESAEALVATRVDAEGLLQRTQTAASAPSMELLTVAPDPWGGALVAWMRPDPTGGAARFGTGRYSFVTRVCPARR